MKAPAKTLLSPRWMVLALGWWLLFLTGCDTTPKTIEQLRQDIANYPVAPTPTAEAQISQGFAALDEEIARLLAHGRSQQAATLQQTRNELQAQYDAAKITATLRKASEAVKQFSDTVRQAGEQLGEIFHGEKPPPAGNE